MNQSIQTPARKRLLSRLLWGLGASALLFSLLFLCALMGIRAMCADIAGFDAARRWQAEDSAHPYTRLSLYFDSTAALDLNDVYLHRMNLTQTLEGNALAAPEGASIFIDAFSGETEFSVTTDRASIRTAATVCGGDFFFFHPLDWIHGGGFSEDDLDVHTVVLDEYAAWQLFGASEVAGMDVTIDGQRFRIAGVCRKPTDPLDAAVWGDTPRIFVNYIGLRMTNGYDRATGYEIILPNPIDGFAHGILKQEFSVTETSANAVLSEESERFTLETLARASADFFMRSVRRDRILPPFWENRIRVTETKAIVAAFFGAVCGMTALLCAVGFVILWFTRHPFRMAPLYHFIYDRYEARRMKRWLKQQSSADHPSEPPVGNP